MQCKRLVSKTLPPSLSILWLGLPQREEEARKDEEKTRAADDRRRLERERVLKERREAEERERKMNEKLQKIEEQRYGGVLAWGSTSPSRGHL